MHLQLIALVNLALFCGHLIIYSSGKPAVTQPDDSLLTHLAETDYETDLENTTIHEQQNCRIQLCAEGECFCICGQYIYNPTTNDCNNGRVISSNKNSSHLTPPGNCLLLLCFLYLSLVLIKHSRYKRLTTLSISIH